MPIQLSPLFCSCAAALLFAALAAGCSGESEGEPSSSGAVGAGASSSGTASGTSSSSSGTGGAGVSSSSGAAGSGTMSSSTGGGGSCAHCSDALTTGDASNLCPSSQVLYDTLDGCRCGILCGTDCTSVCGGGPDDSGCITCVNAQCHSELADCVGDK